MPHRPLRRCLVALTLLAAPSAWADGETAPTDTLSSHVVVGGSAAFALPFGKVSEGVSQRDRVGTGFTYQLDLGYGVSRHVVVGAWGEFSHWGEGNDCRDCSATSFAGGPFVRYHLAQGLRFDPWLSYGLGYRSQTTNQAAGPDLAYGGVDWARLQIGGDWYPLAQVGFGPFLELDGGTFFSRPEGESAGGVYFRFLAGLRIVLDLPGK